MFPIRWRWNATRALALPRHRGGHKVPAPLQRMESENLLAAVFPDQLACLENIAGDREVPDHPLVKQTIEDCLIEAMDILEQYGALCEALYLMMAADRRVLNVEREVMRGALDIVSDGRVRTAHMEAMIDAAARRNRDGARR